MKYFCLLLLTLFQLIGAMSPGHPEESLPPTPASTPTSIQFTYPSSNTFDDLHRRIDLTVPLLPPQVTHLTIQIPDYVPVVYPPWYKEPRIMLPACSIGVILGGMITAFMWYFKKL